MSSRHSATLLLQFVAALCLALPCAAATAASPATLSPPAGSRTLVDLDLTMGSAGPGVVIGGRWTPGGWQTTGAKGERILFDAGRPLANGCLEIVVTLSGLPWTEPGSKINYVGLHEDASLDQRRHNGDFLYARIGSKAYRFSCVKAAGRSVDRSEPEPRLGRLEDWITDGVTEHLIRLEWRDGLPVFHQPNAAPIVFLRELIGDYPIDELRYAFLGTDNFSERSLPGLTFKHVRFIDYGPRADVPPPSPLKIEPAGRSFVNTDGRPIWIMADTAWNLVCSATRADVTAYLTERRAQRFNTIGILLFRGTGPNAHGAEPFHRDAAGRADPLRPRITPGHNPDNPAEYDYWDHIAFIVAEARRLGLNLLILPYWGSNVTGGHDGTPDQDLVLTKHNAYGYAQWLGARYRDAHNLFWLHGANRPPQFPERQLDFRPVIAHLAEGLADGLDGIDRPDDRADFARHFMSYGSLKGAPQSSELFHASPWLTFNSIQRWPEEQLPSLARDWAARPAKPTWIYEGRHEAHSDATNSPEQWGPWQMRFQAWQAAFSGAFGHAYGHRELNAHGRKPADWARSFDTPGAKSMTHLAKFMADVEPRDFLAREPDQSLLDGAPGEAGRYRSDRITALRGANGRMAAFYSAAGKSIRVRLDRLAEGKFWAFWFNPRNGNWHVDGNETVSKRFFEAGIAAGPGTGIREFVCPTAGDEHDWVLALSAVEYL